MIYKVIISESYSVGIEADEVEVDVCRDTEATVTFYKYTRIDKSEEDIIAIFNLANIIGFFIEKGDNEE